MIDRQQATMLAIELAGDAPIIGGIGNATFDLAVQDRPANFYMWNSMGMAVSIGLGLALARPDRRVVVLEGDGSVLYNLSALPTARLSGARNLVYVVWDNGGWEITGAQPVGTSFGIDLEVIARGSGFARTATVDTLEDFQARFAAAMADDESWLIVARIDSGDSALRPPSKNLVALRDRFMAAVGPPTPQ